MKLQEEIIRIQEMIDSNKKLESYQKLIDNCINTMKDICENLNSETDEFISFETCSLIDADVKVKLKYVRTNFGAKQFIVDITYDDLQYIDEDSFKRDLHLELKKWIGHNSILVDEYKNVRDRQW